MSITILFGLRQMDLCSIVNDPACCEELGLALSRASSDNLKSRLYTQIEDQNETRALIFGYELSRRGIPPCFRGTNLNDGELFGPESGQVFALLDLQWIAMRYPRHKPHWGRAKGIFFPRNFTNAARFLLWGGRRSPGQIAVALNLTDQQQLECTRVEFTTVSRRRSRLIQRIPFARERITESVRMKDRRSTEEQDATIRRRVSLWICAELGDWKPQRTADWYEMKTGESIPRNLVAKQLAKLPKVRRTSSVSSLSDPSPELSSGGVYLSRDPHGY